MNAAAAAAAACRLRMCATYSGHGLIPGTDRKTRWSYFHTSSVSSLRLIIRPPCGSSGVLLVTGQVIHQEVLELLGSPWEVLPPPANTAGSWAGEHQPNVRMTTSRCLRSSAPTESTRSVQSGRVSAMHFASGTQSRAVLLPPPPAREIISLKRSSVNCILITRTQNNNSDFICFLSSLLDFELQVQSSLWSVYYTRQQTEK